MTIKYDRHVHDLIDELNATGHVTHNKYRKTSVTLHHNGGRFTYDEVLKIWTTRPASAHFDVDKNQEIAQYVKVNEYAWAAGNTEGNIRSIHIEMSDLTGAPTYKVEEATWVAAARLAGFLFAKVIGEKPHPRNLFYHHHWTPTACAGPYMDSVYGHVLAKAQRSAEHFR